MKKVQHEKSATWKNCNKKKVQHGKSAPLKKCNMKKLQYEKVQHEKVQHGKSRDVARTPQTSKNESFATIVNDIVNDIDKALRLRFL